MRYSYLVGLFVGAFLLGGPGLAQAQVYPQGDISVIVGFPQGEFEHRVDNPGFGLNLFAGLGFGRSPVVLGVEGGFLIYGFERRHEPFSRDIPDVTVEVQTSNAIAMGHMVLRLQPPSGTVRPYVDGLLGVKYFFTETSVYDDYYDEEIASTTNFDDAALSYGVGGGLDLELYRGRGRRSPQIMLNVGARYLFGTEAEYLQEGSIERHDGYISFFTDRSETHLLVTQLGVKIKF